MNNKWMYGDSWEKYPIEKNQLWIEQKGGTLSVYDILDGLPEFMKNADMIYSDTPWNTGNISSFYTKAGLEKRTDFNQFSEVLFSYIKTINPKICYLEIGKQNHLFFMKKLEKIYPIVQSWDIVYYRKNPMKLLRGGFAEQQFNFTGMDDEDTPKKAMQNESFSCVADFCMGRGNTAVSAFCLEKKFVGTELNKRRLACAIEKIANLGGVWKNENW